MKHKQLNDSLLDLYIEELDSCSKDEINLMLINAGLDPEVEYKKVIEGINDTILQAKKIKLRDARISLEALNEITEVKSVFSDAKTKMINLIQSGIAPREITMAFRDGEDISDDEMATILQDLIDLGIDIDEV